MTQQNVPEQGAEASALTKVYGNLGADPVLRQTSKGTPVVNFSVAHNEGEGENRTTTWHRVSLFGKEAEKVSQTLKKGDFVNVEGELRHGSYEKDGVEIQTSNINADYISRCKFEENGEKHWERIAGVSAYVKAQRAKEAPVKGQEADQGR